MVQPFGERGRGGLGDHRTAANGRVVPVGASAHRAARLVEDATLKVCPGAPHGLTGDFEEAFNADLLDFIKK